MEGNTGNVLQIISVQCAINIYKLKKCQIGYSREKRMQINEMLGT